MIPPKLLLLAKLLQNITSGRSYDYCPELTSWDCELITYLNLQSAINVLPRGCGS